ncbi:MAG: hypothetical protein MRQ13_02385 [Candidatus Midichloria sp.]|nr:hypothetical protein [Candidatus Midichloria sp.]
MKVLTTQEVTKLLRVDPKNSKLLLGLIAGYILSVIRQTLKTQPKRLKLTITDSWSPWENIEGLNVNECELLDCSPTKKQDRVCLPGGKVVNSVILINCPALHFKERLGLI